MSSHSIKYGKSKFKYVAKQIIGEEIRWSITINGYARKRYKTEREAAIAVDKIMIYAGKEPPNIFVRK